MKINLSPEMLNILRNAVDEAIASAEDCTDNFDRGEGDEYNEAAHVRRDHYYAAQKMLEEIVPTPIKELV
jgi:hypothetical protein